jgi:hypothetical protein
MHFLTFKYTQLHLSALHYKTFDNISVSHYPAINFAVQKCTVFTVTSKTDTLHITSQEDMFSSAVLEMYKNTSI